MAEATPIRVALIGFGLGGESFHAPLIACTPGLQLTTIVTSNAERRARAQRSHPGANVVDSAEHVWASAARHDMAVVTTNNRSHLPLAMAALGAGLHVVVDKPFAPTADEACKIVDEAKRRDLLAIPYFNRRWDSEMLTARRLLAEGALGDVMRFESRLERWRPVPKGGWRELGAPEEAGGLLYDLGTHLIDQALHLFGPVSEVYCELDGRRTGMLVDDDVFLALTHKNGVRSHLLATAVSAIPSLRMRILGTKAAYLKHHADIQEEALRSGHRPDEPRWGEEPVDHWGLLGAGDQAQSVASEPGAYQAFYAGVRDAIATGAPPPVAAQDAVTGLEVLEAAQRSARDRTISKL